LERKAVVFLKAIHRNSPGILSTENVHMKLQSVYGETRPRINWVLPECKSKEIVPIYQETAAS
jgi:hypothetical protein